MLLLLISQTSAEEIFIIKFRRIDGENKILSLYDNILTNPKIFSQPKFRRWRRMARPPIANEKSAKPTEVFFTQQIAIPAINRKTKLSEKINNGIFYRIHHVR